MSEEFVNKVTLEYLVNKDYNVTLKTSKNNVNKKDKKFYRKRIFNLTKELLSNEEPANLLPDVKHAFDNYMNHCIHYFKVIDCSDILQEDYKDIALEGCDGDFDENSQQTQDEANKLMMRSINIQSTTLDKFIKRTVKKDTTIMPQQKDVDLSNPDLKLKGVKKKKNLTNTYEDTKEITQETYKKDEEQPKNENKDGAKDGGENGGKETDEANKS